MRRIGLVTLGFVAAAIMAPNVSAETTPLGNLPTVAPPTAPYAIGWRVYANGTVVDLASKHGSSFDHDGFSVVVGGRGVTWTGASIFYTIDGGSEVGRLTASLPWKVVGSNGCCAWNDFVTTGGLAGALDPRTSNNAEPVAVTSSGSIYATYPSQVVGDSSCGPAGYSQDHVFGAAGSRFLVSEVVTCTQRRTFLWYPGSRPQELPSGYYALGRLGPGWLGKYLGSGCWKTTRADYPYAFRTPRLCSQAWPLVSPDGTRVVLVQSGKVRVVDATTGATVSRAALGAITTGWNADETKANARFEVPSTWETSDSYLVFLHYDSTLALVRCSVSTGRCGVAVRSYVRTEVDRIATERGATYATPPG